MEFLRINASKLKVTLTAPECERYGIRERDGEYDSRLVREVISEILDEAGAGDFCRSREKLLVQLYPARGGGAEIFITKLSQLGERERRAIGDAQNISTYERERAFFLFDSIDDLVGAAKILARRKKRADLYLRADKRLVLALEEERLGRLSDCDILTEFAIRLSPLAEPRPEWDKLIARGDAIERVMRLNG